MDETANLSLPYIMPQQAQKYVTHNEALRDLDSLVQLAVLDRDLATPPPTPAAGDRYIVAASATGAWGGHSGSVAAFQDGTWLFYTPQRGWRVWIEDEALLVAWNGAAWITAGGLPINPAEMLGVLATADSTNRLSVKSDAALFANDDITPGTGDMRIAVSKAASANTASLIFEDAFSGRAEFGLTGDDDLHLKVSPDGSVWREGLRIAGSTGIVSFPSGVGDAYVILATGQSNFSRTPAYSWSPPANLGIWNWDGTDGHVGTAFAAADATTMNVSWAFAAELARRSPERRVLLINVSFPGQAISHWKTGTGAPDTYANITANIVPALAAAGASGIDTLLWWQGEADAPSPATYMADFETVIARFRGETWFPRTTPIVVFGITSAAISGTAYYGAFNSVLQACVAADPDCRMFVYPATLPQSYWDAPTSYQHLTATGYYLAGFMAAHDFLDGVGRGVLQNLFVDVENARLMFSPNAAPLPVPPSGTIFHLANVDGSATRAVIDSFGGSGAPAPSLTMRAARGTAASPAAVQANDILFNQAAFGRGATGYSASSRGAVLIAAAENWSDTAQGTTLGLYTTPIGTTAAAQHAILDPSGQFGVGGAPARQLHASLDDAANAAVTELLRITHTTSGSPTAGIGAGVEFEVETATGNNKEIGMTVEAITTSVTGAAENFDLVVKLMAAGAAASEAFRVKAGGKMSLPAGSFAANGSVATALSSVGPTGAHTAVQKWLTVDDAGTTRYIPCF